MATQLTNLNTEPAKLFAAAIRNATYRHSSGRTESAMQSRGDYGCGRSRGGMGGRGGRDGGRFTWRHQPFTGHILPPTQALKRPYPGNPYSGNPPPQ